MFQRATQPASRFIAKLGWVLQFVLLAWQVIVTVATQACVALSLVIVFGGRVKGSVADEVYIICL